MPIAVGDIDGFLRLGELARLLGAAARWPIGSRVLFASGCVAATLTASLPARAQTVLYRVNCGGPALPALDAGPSWGGDLTGAQSSPYVNAAATGDHTFGSSATLGPPHASVPATVPLAVFDSERWDPDSDPEMRWEFPLANGTYRVNLLVAEAYAGTQFSGARTADVVIEGVVRLPAYDIYARYGGYRGAMETLIATVADGGLSIEFRHGQDDPAIRGIEIEAISASGVLSPSRGSVEFGVVPPGQTSAPQQVVLTNLGAPGDPAISITAASVTGSFSHTLTPQTLAPGQSRTFNLTFMPAATGPVSGTLSIAHSGTGSPLVLTLSGSGSIAPTISFGKSVLSGGSLTHPTSLQFGPDGRLYVAQQDGLIRVFGVQRNGPNQYVVTTSASISSVQQLPNHDDDGTLNSSEVTRLVTGLLVAGTAANPIVYVTSSDPRMHVAGDINLDTNSGILSRLRWNDSAWVHRDLVRGLPRSENDHATNGMALDPSAHLLYVAQGGNTNMGAPSNNFSFLPEYALAGAILSVDLDAIGENTYDLPTLDDETRAGSADANDPFGGNDGLNQARWVPGGPVQVHSPGWRNPYDVVWTSQGRLYAIDNGPNAGWGGPPVGEGPGANCTNVDNDANSASLQDNLHWIPAAGFYAGHPNPTRASTTNRFNASNPQSPVTTGNPLECEYLEPGVPRASGGDGALATWNFSTDGLTEYRASNFGGAMLGDLLASSYDNTIQRVVLNAAGDSARSVQALFNSVSSVPLDVTAQGDGDTLRGTVWSCDYVSGSITIYEPADYDGAGISCSGADDPLLDEDGDGYNNADEIENAVSPCSAGDLPADFDHDFVSDRNDPDDDGDGLSDLVDAFALDASNGATPLPVVYSWDGGDPGTGLFGLGFTGLMADGVTDYRTQFDPVQITAGGAAGKLTLDAVSPGDSRGAINTQREAFQFGVATTAASGPFRVRTRVSSPYFGGAAPAGAQSIGVVIGDGGDDDYLKLVVTGSAGQPALEVVHETAGVVSASVTPVAGLLSGVGIDLVLDVNPGTATVQPRFAIGNGALQPLGSPRVLTPGSALHAAVTGAPPLAIGIISTSRGASPFTATWDFIEVVPNALIGVGDSPALPLRVRLLAAVPNPSRGGHGVRYELPAAAFVRLTLFDLSGARVRVLDEGTRAPGTHAVRWDGLDARGRSVPAGIYFQRLEVGGEHHTQRIAVLR